MNDQILGDINEERTRQNLEWGGYEHDDKHSTHDWITYIVKHLGKAVKWPVDFALYRYQMVRVAALAVAAIEWTDRNWVTARTKMPVKPLGDGTYAEAEPFLRDYDILTDALEDNLQLFLHDDDVAAVAIYAEAIEHAGEFTKKFLAWYAIEINRLNGRCPTCGRVVGVDGSLDDHGDNCPAGVNSILVYLESNDAA